MTPKRRSFWERVGDAIRAFGEDVADSVSDVLEGEPEPPSREHPRRTSERERRAASNRALGLEDHGPYLPQWSQDERDLWDAEPNTFRQLYDSDDEWSDLQDAFHYGWLETGMTREEHDEYREQFYNISGVVASSFDWQAFREYWDQHGSPSYAR